MEPADALPRMRQDLRIYKGAPLASGAPGWVILDPVRHRYFQIGRTVLEILNAWGAGTTKDVQAQITTMSGRPVSPEEIAGVRQFLEVHELTDEPKGGAQGLAKKAMAARHHWIAWLIHNYLFFKIPLIKPQRFLDATRGFGRVWFSRATLTVFALLAVFTAALIARRWDTFVATAISFLTLDSFITYGFSLVLVKTLHELGHAYMATRYNVRVPSMGVAFMVLAPFLYSDVSDAWRLTSRRKRMAIGAAGMLAESMLAVLALLAWVFLPDGAMRSAAFVTGTTSMIASLFLNLNPFMRFDGYYLLADAVGVPNLQTRAMAIGRWRMREFLWGLGAPPPDSFGPIGRRVLALYAYSIWIYRFFLFLGIAVLVYHMAFKVLGIILFLIEIVWFVLRPIWSELVSQWKGRAEILKRPRSLVTLSIFLLGLVAIFAPLSARVDFPALAMGSTDVALYPSAPGWIERIERREGERVRAGDAIIVLRSPDLESEIERVGLKLALLERRVARVAADAGERSELTVLEGQREAESLKLASLKTQERELVVRSTSDGVLRDVDPALRIGLWTGMRTLLARVVDGPGAEVRGYIEEADLRRVSPGASGRFIPEDPLLPSYAVQISFIGRTAVEDLDLLPLAAQHEGPIPVSDDGRKKLKPSVSIYPVTMSAAAQPDLATSRRGRVFIEGAPESFASRALRRVVGVLIRESGA